MYYMYVLLMKLSYCAVFPIIYYQCTTLSRELEIKLIFKTVGLLLYSSSVLFVIMELSLHMFLLVFMKGAE